MAKTSTPILKPDGTLNIERRGTRAPLWGDLYHRTRRATWPWVLFYTSILWLLVNVVFASLYLLGGDCIAGAERASFGNAFFFSVQTLSTIGYGSLAPVGLYANILMTIEALLGLLITAVTTGLLFSKFSTPTARVMFSRNALITSAQGERVFMFRMANERSSQVLEARVQVTMIFDDPRAQGEGKRRFVDLTLKRSNSPIFSLGWTAVHVIDEESPLRGMRPHHFAAARASFLVVFSGYEDTLAANVHARHAYSYADLLYDVRYVETMQTDGDNRYIDFSVFHDTKPIENPSLAVMTRI